MRDLCGKAAKRRALDATSSLRQRRQRRLPFMCFKSFAPHPTAFVALFTVSFGLSGRLAPLVKFSRVHAFCAIGSHLFCVHCAVGRRVARGHERLVRLV